MKPWSKSVFVNAAGKSFDMKLTIQQPYLQTFFAPSSGLSTLGLLHENLELFNLLVPDNPALKDLRSLSLFTSLGVLDFTGNKLLLKHLVPLQSIIIMNLVITDNPALDSLPYFRPFMILAFPLLWCLNGEYIYDEERRLAKRLLTIHTNYQKLTRLQQHLLQQAETIQISTIASSLQMKKSSPSSPKKPSQKLLKFNKTRFEALHISGTLHERLAYIYETYDRLIANYIEATPKECISGDIFNSLLVSQDFCDKLSGFKSIYPQNLSILFIRITTLRKRLPTEFHDMFYMLSLSLHNFPLILHAINTSESNHKQPSRPLSSKLAQLIPSTPSSKPLTLSATSLTPDRRTSTSLANTSTHSDFVHSTPRIPSSNDTLSPSSSKLKKTLPGSLFSFLSDPLRSFCKGYKFNLPSIYYEIFRNYYGDGPITELLSELYGTTLLGVSLGFSMMSKPLSYKRILHTLLLEDLGRGCQFSFYDFHVLAEATISWYLTLPCDSRFDTLFKNIIVAISIATNIFKEYTRTATFIKDGFIPEAFEDKFRNSYSVIINEITGSADDFAWSASFSQYHSKTGLTNQESKTPCSQEDNQLLFEKSIPNDSLLDHYLHKAVSHSNMPILTKSYENFGKLPVIVETVIDTDNNQNEIITKPSSSRISSHGSTIRDQGKVITPIPLSPDVTHPSLSQQPAISSILPKQQQYSMENYLIIAESLSKSNIPRDINSYNKLLQVNTRTLTAKGVLNPKTPKVPANLSSRQVTTTFCAGQYHKAKMYVPADFKYSLNKFNNTLLEGSDLTQYDLDKIQLPQVEKSKVLMIEPSYLLGNNVEEHTLKQANMSVEASLVRNYIANGSLASAHVGNYARLQHADILSFMGKMKKKPRILYPHLHLVQQKIAQVQRDDMNMYLQTSENNAPKNVDLNASIDCPSFHSMTSSKLADDNLKGGSNVVAVENRSELPFFNKNEYNRLLALENRVKEYYNEQIKLRAITQTTHRRLYSIALKEHLQMSIIHRNNGLLTGDGLSIIDIEHAGGHGASKNKKIHIHPKRTDEIIKKNMIRHLPRMFKSSRSLTESLQFEAILSGYQQSLREITPLSEIPVCQEFPQAITKSDVFITELQHQNFANEDNTGLFETSEDVSTNNEAQLLHMEDKGDVSLPCHIITLGSGAQPRNSYTTDVSQISIDALVDNPLNPILRESHDFESSQRPAVSLGLKDLQTETDSVNIDALPAEFQALTNENETINALAFVSDNISTISSPSLEQQINSSDPKESQVHEKTYTESSNLIVNAMIQDEEPR